MQYWRTVSIYRIYMSISWSHQLRREVFVYMFDRDQLHSQGLEGSTNSSRPIYAQPTMIYNNYRERNRENDV